MVLAQFDGLSLSESFGWHMIREEYFIIDKGITMIPHDTVEGPGSSEPKDKSSETIKNMVNNFLRWPLPESVNCDLCATEHGTKGRRGTNLLTAIEAEQMLTYVTADLVKERDFAERVYLLALEKSAKLELEATTNQPLYSRRQLAKYIDDLELAVNEVIRISDRQHDAWDRLKSLLAARASGTL